MVSRTTSEELKRQVEREQDEVFIQSRKENLSNKELREKLVAEQDEKLRIQGIHSSRNLEFKEKEKIKLVPVREAEDLKIGFQSEVKRCSGFVELHGEKWANFDTDIYLTFSHWKIKGRIVKNEQGEYLTDWDNKPTKITENYCLYCANETFNNWWGIVVADFDFHQRNK